MQKKQIVVLGGFIVVVAVLAGVFFLGKYVIAAVGGATGSAGQHSWVRVHATDIEGEIAQGMNITTDQIKTDLKAGKTINQIATAHNVSDLQLHALEIKAYQDAGLKALAPGSGFTQQQIDAVTNKLQGDSQQLDSVTSNLFLDQNLHLGV